jgi:GNAT superfamily N-acetyltransferase
MHVSPSPDARSAPAHRMIDPPFSGHLAELPHERVLMADGELVCFRPLHRADMAALTEFLQSLSPQTRKRWNGPGYGRTTAAKLCAGNGKTDRLCLVGVREAPGEPQILALMEISVVLTQVDAERYQTYDVMLNAEETVRFGPVVRDSHQARGLASALMPTVFAVARRLGRQCIILWGGVTDENRAAIRFYQKHGFRAVGHYHDEDGKPQHDMMVELDS